MHPTAAHGVRGRSAPAWQLNLKPSELQLSEATAEVGESAAGARTTPPKKRSWTGRVFESPAGVPILVGRNRRENEELSLRVASHRVEQPHIGATAPRNGLPRRSAPSAALKLRGAMGPQGSS